MVIMKKKSSIYEVLKNDNEWKFCILQQMW
jgi:hypothetical protein